MWHRVAYDGYTMTVINKLDTDAVSPLEHAVSDVPAPQLPIVQLRCRYEQCTRNGYL